MFRRWVSYTSRVSNELEIQLDQFWECPKCGAQMAMGWPAQLHPPTCQLGHVATEMEQVTAAGFGTVRW